MVYRVKRMNPVEDLRGLVDGEIVLLMMMSKISTSTNLIDNKLEKVTWDLYSGVVPPTEKVIIEMIRETVSALAMVREETLETEMIAEDIVNHNLTGAVTDLQVAERSLATKVGLSGDLTSITEEGQIIGNTTITGTTPQ